MTPAIGSLDWTYTFPYTPFGIGIPKRFTGVFKLISKPAGCTFVCYLEDEDSLNTGCLSYPEITMIYDTT